MQFIKKIFFFLLIVFLFYSLTKNIFNYQKKLKFYEGFKNDYLKEKKENSMLKTQVLKNKDPNQTEKIIRDKLNLTKPDETAIIVDLPTPTIVVPTPTPIPNWEQWIEVFMK